MDSRGFFRGRTILITGGTGTFGRAITRRLLDLSVKEIRIYSRDEKKQLDMQRELNSFSNIRFIIGNVRDRQDMRRAMSGVDLVFHAAALKQVPTCESFPIQAIDTNIRGAQLVIDAAIEAGVGKVIAISTDKAVEAVNVMGLTKALQEKLMVAANHRSDQRGTVFCCARYGNVLGSRGSVVPFFRRCVDQRRPISLTDDRMTRFMITLSEAVDHSLRSIHRANGGEIFVRICPSHRIKDLAEVIIEAAGYRLEEYKIEQIGIRPGEKLHETLLSPTESLRTLKEDNYYVVQPFSADPKNKSQENKFRPEPFRFSSDNAAMLSRHELKTLLHNEGWLS